MSDPVVYSGRCLCGAVKAEIVAEPLWVANCHCPSCRKTTSAAFATYVGFDRTAVAFKGDKPRTFRSSPGVTRSFCGVCGGPVTFEGEAWPGEIHFHIGFLDQAADLKPESNVFVSTALPWVHLDDNIPRYKTFPRDEK